MSEKKPLNLAVPVELLDEFNHVCQHYGHAKQKGMVLSAAILMFLRADPKVQGQHLEEIATAEIQDGVKRMLERIKREQGLIVATREATEHASDPSQREADSEYTGDSAVQQTAAEDQPPSNLPIDDNVNSNSVNPEARPRKAAKKAGDSVRKVTHLKSAEDLKNPDSAEDCSSDHGKQ